MIAKFPDFFFRVGMMLDTRAFSDLPIKPKNLLCSFHPYNVQELIAFCINNPEYHIVSLIPGVSHVNGYCSKGFLFFLADGEKNPRLAHSEKRFVTLDDGSIVL
jgi:hypothetical protein